MNGHNAANLYQAFHYDSKTLCLHAFSAKEANLFLHNHLKSWRFDINKRAMHELSAYD